MKRPTPVAVTFAIACVILLADAAPLWAQGNPKYALWTAPAFLRGANIALSPTERPALADFIALRQAGANLVQLSARGIQKTQPPFADDTASATRLSEAVENADSAGLYVVIAMRTGPGLEDVAVEAQTPGLQSKLWVDSNARSAFQLMWRRLAEEYRSDPHVIGYNLIVEPLPEAAVPGLSTCCASVSDTALLHHGISWPAIADTLVSVIRQVDSVTPIVVGATGFALPPFFASMRPVTGSYIVYDVHQYEPHSYTHQGTSANYPVGLAWPGARFRYWRDNRDHVLDTSFLRSVLAPVVAFQHRAGDAPVFVGEFGVNRQAPGAADFINSETAIFRELGWHGAMWIWGCCGRMEVTAADSASADPQTRAILEAYQEYWRTAPGPH